MTLAIEHAWIIYTMYRAGEVSVHRACCDRATQPYSRGGGGTIWPGSRPAGGHNTLSANSNRGFTHSLDVKMYVYAIYSRFRIGTILFIRLHGYEIITTLSLSSLMSPFSLSCHPLLMRNTLVLSTYLDVRARLSISNLRLPSDRRIILIGRLPHLAMISSPRGISI